MKVRLHVFETIQSLLLFAVSTLFTCERFAELAGNTLASKLPFIMLGLGFEITRVSLWIRYCLENDRTFKIVALFLTVLSMTASLSKITASLETIDSKSVSVVESINITNEVIKSYDEQIAVLTERLKATPQEYVNTAKRLQEQIDKLLSAKMEALGKKTGTGRCSKRRTGNSQNS